MAELTEIEVEVLDVEACPLAAVRGHATRATLPAEIGRLLDLVWPFVRAQDVVTNHNVVYYDEPLAHPDGAAIVAGVQVDRRFEETSPEGVAYMELPAGRVARAVHRGPYDQMGPTHEAVVAHILNSGLRLSGASWEVYGDWHEDPAQLETEISYGIAPGGD